MEELRSIAKFLGINTKNKSAEDLSTLIKETTTKQPAAQPPNVVSPNALSKHFNEGRLTDCSIHVRIGEAPAHGELKSPAELPASERSKATETEPEGPAKRLGSESGEASGEEARAESEARADDAESVRVIKAHAVILASRSEYFDRAMGGEWRESQDRSFEVEVADEQEYVTFRRLIKLCYGSTFIKEGGRDLDFSELVHLIHVANAFECMDAVKECVAALINRNFDWEGAVQCVELTDMLEDVEGMEDLAEKATEAMAKELGLVHELFVPSDEDDAPDVLGGLKLSDKVKDLSPTVFEALICSDGLQLKTANETFWLLLAWVEAQSEESEEGKQELFKGLAERVWFTDMDPGYILLLVSEHPRIIAAGVQGTVFRECMIHANLARRTSDDIKLFERKATLDCTLLEPTGGKPEWTFDVKFTAPEVAAIEPGKKCRKIVGLAAGLPWSVSLTSVKPKKGTESGQRLGVYTMCSLPFEWMTFEDGAGFYFNYRIEVGMETPHKKRLASRTWSGAHGAGGTFGAWEDVFREGSEWLVNGELHVRVTVMTTNDQGPLTLTADA